MKKIFITVAVVGVALIGWAAYITLDRVPAEVPGADSAALAAACASTGGNWIESVRECEYVSADWCTAQGGSFNECASACRNNPEAEVCTMQCVPVCALSASAAGTAPVGSASSPLDATYVIEGMTVTLSNGRNETPVVPGSATVLKTTIFGEPAVGDLDGDGDDDAALILVSEPGGSGTFYYLVAARNDDFAWNGTNAILLGDRIAPQNVSIKDQVIVANYADRKPTDAMTVSPSLGVTAYATVQEGTLSRVPVTGKGESVMAGWLVMAPEVRTFTNCRGDEYWVLGTSSAYRELMRAYESTSLSSVRPNGPLFVTLAGTVAAAPTDGFGADYDQAISASTLLSVPARGGCRSEVISVSSPLPHDVVVSPVRFSGAARGPWFFEASFPVLLKDGNGTVLAQGIATAQGEWMTESFVPFSGELSFSKEPATRTGTLVFKKDNPSGLPEHDDEYAIPVRFR